MSGSREHVYSIILLVLISTFGNKPVFFMMRDRATGIHMGISRIYQRILEQGVHCTHCQSRLKSQYLDSTMRVDFNFHIGTNEFCPGLVI